MNDSPLLELVSREELSARKGYKMGHKANNDVRMYCLLREPEHLEEFDWETNEKIIWCDNDTIICVCSRDMLQYDETSYFSFSIERENFLHGTVFGKTDAAIAETATWLLSLSSLRKFNKVIVGGYATSITRKHFDVASFSAKQLTQILGANPTRCISFIASQLTTEQIVYLAKRPFPISLKLNRYQSTDDKGLRDEGTTLVDALENRQSAFGSLELDASSNRPIMSRANLERLLRLDFIIDKLSLDFLHADIVLSPFVARVQALNYNFTVKDLRPEDFETLDIVAKDLKLTINLDGATQWSEILISLLNRLACLGHFESLSFSFDTSDVLPVTLGSDQALVHALVNVIAGNPHLISFDFENTHALINMAPYKETICQALEEHRGLRSVIFHKFPPFHRIFAELLYPLEHSRQQELWYSVLERLLSRNRRINVCDNRGNRYTNGSTIDTLYALNDFYNGSFDLLKEDSTSLRPLYVATALTAGASANFQCAALLLSDHTDILCEFLHNEETIDSSERES
ncbi:hypothetical protein FisN_10Lh407 [Fistulifera solaris]|uniref:Uncharacterized protein n=1 Tax=Fistulifera solaris TaxID=1519565 RepID=A0A1Z5JV06_FISSO|nr:hypothetical protein FisN_10Lh407 [Fistulifera solaris]|eukprot:GAX17696.1 hypothetical protein FisN_10Lh407 [Fistulifera solaris]